MLRKKKFSVNFFRHAKKMRYFVVSVFDKSLLSLDRFFEFSFFFFCKF